MRYFPFKPFVPAVAFFIGAASVSVLAQMPAWSEIGTTPTQEEIRAEAKGVGPSGTDLPPGRGTAGDGMRIFARKCAMCHGRNLEGVTPPPSSGSLYRGPRLVGGEGVTLWGSDGPNPGVSKLYYTAYVTTLWNGIAISMPFLEPGSLTADEVYSLVAYILYKNEFIQEDDVMDRETLPQVQLPQRNNHIPVKLEDISDIAKRACFKTYGVCP